MSETGDSLEAVPQGYLQRLLAEFGIQWTNIIILSGIVITSFGLERYVNAGIWALCTIAALSLVYLFRAQIGPQFPRYFVASFLFIAGGTAALLLYANVTHRKVHELLAQNRNLTTVGIAFCVGVPLGVCIISYRRQSDQDLLSLPAELGLAASDNLLKSEFFHAGVDYVVEFSPPNAGFVDVTYEVTLRPVNRTLRTVEYRDVFDPAGVEDSFLHASIDGKAVDVEDPEYRSGRGLVLRKRIPSHAVSEWTVKGRSRFYDRDSELFGAYIPSTTLSLIVKRPPADLRVVIRSHVPEKVDPRRLPNGDLVFEYARGLLPFQGARLLWEPGQLPQAHVPGSPTQDTDSSTSAPLTPTPEGT